MRERAAARRRGVKDALGIPAAVPAAGMVGFGALAYESGLDVVLAAVCTAGIWALPGQIALIEMYVAGAPGLPTILAVMLTAARFLPMTIALVPVVRGPASSRVALYGAAQLLAMTTWAWTMRHSIDMPRPVRLSYYLGFAATCWAVSIAATVMGYYLAGSFPPIVRLGLVFLNPVYFLVLLVGEARTRLAAIALVCGALAGPFMHLIDPQWSVVLAGVAGGTVAYWIQRRSEARRG